MQERNKTQQPTNGDKDAAYEALQGFLGGPDIIDKAFRTHDQVSAAQMLVKPGEDVSDLTMRGDFPDARFLKACARHLAKCRRFHDKRGEDELLFIVAGFPGIQGKRAAMLVEAVIGERKSNTQGGGFMDKVREAMRI